MARELKITINVGTGNAVTAVQNLINKMNQLNTAAQNTATGTQAATRNVTAAGNAAQRAAGQTNTAAAANQRLAKDTNAARLANQSYKESWENLHVRIGQMLGTQKTLQQRIDENRRSAYALSIAGFQLAVAGRRINEAFKGAIKNFADFDFEVRRAAGAVEIFDDSSKVFNHLKETMHELSIETRLFDAKTLAEGFYFWASATGEVAKTAEDVTRIARNMTVVIQAAAIAHTDLETATKGVVSILNQFKLGSDQTTDVVQKLFYITQKTALELPDLFQSFKYLGPVAKQLNMTFDELVRMAGMIGDVGIKGSQFGRGFRQMLIRVGRAPQIMIDHLDQLVDRMKVLSSEGKLATDELNQRWQSLGDTWKDVSFPEGKFAGFTNYLDRLTEIYDTLDEAEQARMRGILATANELPVLTELIEANSKSWRENGESMFENAETMQDLARAPEYFIKAWEQQANSARAVLGQLRNAITALVHDVGEAAIEMFTPVARVLVEIIGKVRAWARDTEGNLRPLFKFAVGAGMVVGQMLALGGAILIVVGATKLLLGSALPTLAMQLLGIGRVTNYAAAASKAYSVAMRIEVARTKELIAAHGLQLTKAQYAAAMAGARAKAYTKANIALNDSLKTSAVRWGAFGVMMSEIRGKAGGVSHVLSSIPSALGKATGFLRGLLGLGGKLAVVFGVITAAAGLLFGAFRGGHGGVQKVTSTLSTLQSIAGKLGDVLAKVGQFALDLLGGLFQLGEFIGGILAPIVDDIVGDINKLGEAVGWVLDHLNNFFNSVSDGWDGMLDDIRRTDEITRIAQQAGVSLVEAEKIWNDRRIEQQQRANYRILQEQTNTNAEMQRQAQQAWDEMLNDQMEFEQESAALQHASALANMNIQQVLLEGQREDELEAQRQRLWQEAQFYIRQGEISEEAARRIIGIAEETAEEVVDRTAAIYIDAEGRVYDASEAGFAKPLGITMSNVRGIVEEGALDAIEIFTSTLFDSAPEVQEASAFIIETFLSQIESGRPKLRNEGVNNLIEYLKGIYEAAGENAPAYMGEALGFIESAIASKNPRMRQMGLQALIALSEGAAQGSNTNYLPLVVDIVKATLDLLKSSNPEMRRQGVAQALSIAQGFLDGNPNIDATTRYTVEAMVAMMSSADPAMRAAGANAFIDFANGLASRLPNVARPLNAALGMISQFVARASRQLTPFQGPGKPFNIDMIIPDGNVGRISGTASFYSKIAIPRIGGGGGKAPRLPKLPGGGWTPKRRDTEAGEGGGGGGDGKKGKKGKGGGGRGKDQTPLEKALEVAEQGARLVEALRSVQGYDLKQLVRSTMGGVAEAMTLAVKISANASSGVGKKQMRHVADFAEAAGATATMITSTKDAFDAVSRFKGVAKGKIEEVINGTAMAVKVAAQAGKGISTKASVEARMFAETADAVVTAISSAATGFATISSSGYRPVSASTMRQIADDMRQAINAIVDVAKFFQRASLDIASEFSASASEVVTAIAGAFESFSSLPRSYARKPASLFRAIAEDMMVAFREFRAAAGNLQDIEHEATGAFANTASGVVKALADAFAAFGGLTTFTRPAAVIVDELMGAIKDVVRRMVRLSRDFDLTSSEWDAINGFAATVSQVMGALSSTWEAHNKTIEFVDQFRVAVDVDTLFDQMEHALTRFRSMAAMFDAGEIEKVSHLAEAATHIGQAIEQFFAIGRNASNDPNTLERMVLDAVNAVMVTMSNFVEAFRGYGQGVVANFAAGINSELSNLENGGLSPGSYSINVNTTRPKLVIEHVIVDRDGALKNANSQEVAAILSGSEFINNLAHAARTQ